MDDPILIWNEISLEANRVSHTDGSKEQNGPTLSSRALAIVHLAMYDAFAGIDKAANLEPYISSGFPPPPNTPKNLSVAVSAAAYTTLVELFPSQFDYFNAQLNLYVTDTQDPAYKFGVAVAQKILELRKDDPGASQGTFRPAKKRGVHKVDPDNPTQGYHAPFYGERSKGFAVSNNTDFNLDAPPFDDGEDAEYLKALKQVRAKGIKPELMATLSEKLEEKERTPEETLVGLYWGYDGTAGLGTPPRLYNQIIRKIAIAKNNTPAQNAHLFALINTAMGDAGILCWKEKYIHQFWRPVLGIREHDPSFGIREKGESVPSAEKIDKNSDPFWLPLGAPSSNSANIGVPTAQGTFPFANVQIGKVKNFTPNFPAYPSGHATFGAAAFHITRIFYGIAPNDYQPDNLLEGLKETDGNDIFFVSEELNEKTQDNNGTIRPLHRRSFKDGLWGMIIENGLSRVFLGVHWIFDSFALKDKEPDLDRRIGGVKLGLNIAEDIFKYGLKPSTPAVLRTMYAPTIALPKGEVGEIAFNSRSPRLMTVTPTFYRPDGETVIGEAIDLLPTSTYITAIESLIPPEHRGHKNWGGMSISYYGKLMEVAAQITLRDKNRTGSADVLVSPLKIGSDTLEAVWWMPEKGKAMIALGNSSAQAIEVNLQFSDGETQNETIEAFATTYIERKSNEGRVESIKITTTGMPGSLRAIGFVSSNKTSFTGNIRFYDTKNVAQPNLYATNFKPKDSALHLLLKNPTGNAVTATPRFIPLSGENVFELSPVNVPANEALEVDLQALINAVGTKSDLETVSVEILNSGGAGSLIGALNSTNETSGINYDIPLRDCGTAHDSTGGYPARIDGDFTTILSITNVSDKTSKFSLQINHEGGQYALFPQELPAKGTALFDLRKIRDEQIPDSLGKTLPLGLTTAQIRWGLNGDSSTTLIGRAEIVSISNKISSSFSCGACCPPTADSAWIQWQYNETFIGDSLTLIPFQQDIDYCYGTLPPPYPTSGFWQSEDNNIASVYSGEVTANGVGTVVISASWTATQWMEGLTGEYCQDSTINFNPGALVIVREPTVASITATIASTKNPVTNVAPAAGTYTTTNTSTNFATESTEDLMAVFQSPDTAITITADGVNPSSAASQLKWKIERDPNDTVASGTPTLSGTTGSQITLTPTVAGNFRLICYYDANNDNNPDNNEILKVLLFAIVRVTLDTNNAAIDSPSPLFEQKSAVTPPDFAVGSGDAMAITCTFLLEGGGSTKRIGANKLTFGNVGNLISDNAQVNYTGSGTATENPDGTIPLGGTLPVIDSRIDPTSDGGGSAFRGNSNFTTFNKMTGGVEVGVTGDDSPDFGEFLITNSIHSSAWATTQGGYDFKEYIVGFSDKFKKTYFVIATGVWTVRFIGTKNGSGIWIDNGSAVTLQGNTSTSEPLTSAVTGNSPKTGNDAGIKVEGLSFALHHTPVYS